MEKSMQFAVGLIMYTVLGTASPELPGTAVPGTAVVPGTGRNWSPELLSPELLRN